MPLGLDNTAAEGYELVESSVIDGVVIKRFRHRRFDVEIRFGGISGEAKAAFVRTLAGMITDRLRK